MSIFREFEAEFENVLFYGKGRGGELIGALSVGRVEVDDLYWCVMRGRRGLVGL